MVHWGSVRLFFYCLRRERSRRSIHRYSTIVSLNLTVLRAFTCWASRKYFPQKQHKKSQMLVFTKCAKTKQNDLAVTRFCPLPSSLKVGQKLAHKLLLKLKSLRKRKKRIDENDSPTCHTSFCNGHAHRHKTMKRRKP